MKKSVVLSLIVVIVIFVGVIFFVINKPQSDNGNQKDEDLSPQQDSFDDLDEQAPEENSPVWAEAEIVIPGNFADPDVVKISDSSYRIYYGIEPEVPGNNLEVYSATSNDGETWTQEQGIRRTQSVFPDVVKLVDGKWRMYFQ